MRRSYRRREDEKLSPGLTHNQDIVKERLLEPKVKKMKMSNLVDELSKARQLKRITDRDLGALPRAPGRFFVMFRKKIYFKCHWITFYTCSEPFKRTSFKLKKRKLSNSPLTYKLSPKQV